MSEPDYAELVAQLWDCSPHDCGTLPQQAARTIEALVAERDALEAKVQWIEALAAVLRGQRTRTDRDGLEEIAQ